MMLNNLLLSILFFIRLGTNLVTLIPPEKFPIVYISGKVIYHNKESVKAGDYISNHTKLQFDGDSSFILIVKEKHIIKLEQNDFTKKGIHLSGKISCRKLISESAYWDSIYSFCIPLQNDSLIFYSTQQNSSLNKNDFQFKDNNFLLIRFETPGRSFSRKISYSEEMLIFDKPSHFKADTSIHTQQIKVFQYNSSKNRYNQIYLFFPNIISNKELQEINQNTNALLVKLYPNQNEFIKNIQYEIVLELKGVCPKERFINK